MLMRDDAKRAKVAVAVESHLSSSSSSPLAALLPALQFPFHSHSTSLVSFPFPFPFRFTELTRFVREKLLCATNTINTTSTATTTLLSRAELVGRLVVGCQTKGGAKNERIEFVEK